MIEQTLEQLASSQQTLTHKLLRTLSGLDRTGLAAVQRVWPTIPDTRRRQIITSLVGMAEDDAELDFVDVLRICLADTDAEVRAVAVSGLWETNDQTFVDPLIALLRSDPSTQVREAVAELLGHFGMLAVDRQVRGRGKRLLAALLDTFHSTDDPANTEEVRRNALESASFFSDDERVLAAIHEAYADPSLTMRVGAVSAMGMCFDESYAPTVLKEMDNPEPEMRFVAARAAGELLLESAVPRLVEMIQDPDSEVRLVAIAALGEIGGLQAKTTLTHLLESHDEDLRDAAEEALEELRFNEDPLDFKDMLGGARKGKPKNEE
jgi:HEAT repeat protein